ncbi:PTS sugar transporter subunit IIA [Clostridium estertheticum]|uniref:PTS sugar transporter subunit IIA n=1 Tax=Clostridium estertheticum TaxID=238834 RepID=UPI001C7D2537|nr:PTS sugar transporter subunit IIA [Clostridium estertheticum]MBX4263159.1 PTS sugar transporter subunit IIA [Clostridium estertheticum]MBX4269927.1 PTS sugar transporter subunit IIA [Clostridium estertheticum]WLC78443.1 PTS sugar transporter subunit IIA [Clostridium estertheticum]WLC89468.1 PTS sugar transporter subunit IIA [Clostridium estertheticum]
MTESITEYLSKDLIINNLEAETTDDIFYALSKMLLKSNYVKDSFYGGLVARESKFPTGLTLGKYNVAIPHTDAVHVLKPAIAMATLKNPVTFTNMDGDGEVNVNVVFCMILKEPHSQISMLQQLMFLIQNEDVLKSLSEAKDSAELYDILTKFNCITN